MVSFSLQTCVSNGPGTNTCVTSNSSGSSGVSTTLVAGIAGGVGGFLIIVLIVLLVLFLRARNRQRAAPPLLFASQVKPPQASTMQSTSSAPSAPAVCFSRIILIYKSPNSHPCTYLSWDFSVLDFRSRRPYFVLNFVVSHVD
jgi:hypothetical protein